MPPSKPCWRSDAATWKPAWPAPTMTTGSCAIKEPASALRLRHGDDEAVHLRRDHELAAEAAVGQARAAGAFEHRSLVGLHRRHHRQLVLADLDVARRTHAGAAAFGDDAVDAVQH